MRAVAFVGPSGVGKTTVIERLIVEFKRRGYRVAAIKHAAEVPEFGDTPGKDSWRFAQSGSDSVVISSTSGIFCMQGRAEAPSLEDALRLVGDCVDLVLIEGFKTHRTIPKIEIHRRATGLALVSAPETLMAVATDEELPTDVTQLDLFDTCALADFIEGHGAAELPSGTDVFVNGKLLPLKPFVKQLVGQTVLAMVSTFKGVREIRTLSIVVRNGEHGQAHGNESSRSDD